MNKSNIEATEKNKTRLQFVFSQIEESNSDELKRLEDAIGVPVQRREDFLRDIPEQAKNMRSFAEELGVQASACNVLNDEIIQLILKTIQKGAEIIEKRVDGQENFSDAEIELLLVSNSVHEGLMRQKLGQPFVLLLTSDGLEKIFKMTEMFPLGIAGVMRDIA